MPSGTEAEGEGTRILFCTDFSPNADHAFAFAVDAARRCAESTLYLLHVIPEPDAQFWKTYLYEVDGIDGKAERDIDQKIRDTYLARIPSGIRMETGVRVGRPQEIIPQWAREQRMDLIVLGRQGHGALGKMLFGNVSEAVVRKAHCPVLVVPFEREPGRETGGGL